ncbi:MAG: ABC transporter permease [Actinomycetota bacterium]
MSILESFRLAFDALVANKMRALLTMLGVIIGVMAVILLISMGQGVKEDITGQVSGLGSNLLFVMPGRFDFTASDSGGGNGIPTYKLRPADVEIVKKRATLAAGVIGIVEAPTKVTYKNRNRRTIGVCTNETYPIVMERPLAEGRFFTKSQLEAGRRVAVLGKTTANALFGSTSPIGKQIKVGDQKFVVIGVMSTKGMMMGQDFDDGVWVPITLANTLVGHERISEIVVKASDPDRVDETKKEIENILLKKFTKDDFTVFTQGETLSLLKNILNVMTLMLAGLASISLLVGGIGIMNIMLVSVTERTREIGIRKAVGARTTDIMIQFIIEAVMLSALGGLVGIALGIGIALILNNWLPAQITAWSVSLAFFFSAGVGIFFGVYPAWKAARLDPIEALRYE